MVLLTISDRPICIVPHPYPQTASNKAEKPIHCLTAAEQTPMEHVRCRLGRLGMGLIRLLHCVPLHYGDCRRFWSPEFRGFLGYYGHIDASFARCVDRWLLSRSIWQEMGHDCESFRLHCPRVVYGIHSRPSIVLGSQSMFQTITNPFLERLLNSKGLIRHRYGWSARAGSLVSARRLAVRCSRYTIGSFHPRICDRLSPWCNILPVSHERSGRGSPLT